jgi:hypothetical protein
MKQKNVCVLSLLASFMLLIFAGSASADTDLVFVNDPVMVHDCIDTIEVEVTADEAIKAFDVIAEIISQSGGAFAEVLDVTLYPACGTDNGFDLLKIRDGDTDTLRFWGTDLAAACDVIPAGTQLLAEIEVQVGSNLGDFDVCLTDWLILEDPVIAVTNFVNGAAASTTLNFTCGEYTIINTPPYFTNCPTLLVHGCDEGQICYDFDADDDDCGTTLTYSLGPGTGGTINPTTGYWCIDVSHMCGTYSYQIIVTDEHGAQAACNFQLSVTTTTPYFTGCPDDGSVTRLLWGYLAQGSVTAVDDDGCPFPLVYSLFSITGPGPFPGTFNLDPDTGVWSWQTLEDPAYIGTWTVCIDVSDGCKTARCCFDIVVVPTYRVYIDKAHDVYQGHYLWLDIFLSDTTDYFGGYDFLIYYDASALTFMEAALSDDLVDCEWEYFTYRFGPFGNCEGPCPSGLLRIVAMAETNNGPYHPVENCAVGPMKLAKLKFYVTNDRTFGCMYIPVMFYWFDCGDNAISSVSGDTLWISRHVYGYNCSGGYYEITGDPWVGGWQGIVPPIDCTEPLPNKPPALVGIDFYDGGIDIICPDSIDATGDLNLNDIPNEIADAVLYTNYFIYGLSVFDINPEGQIAASDVNNDGRVLTVGDLVYLIRVITGDELAFPKLTPYAMTAQVGLQNADGAMKVTSSSAVDLGAAHFVFSVDGTVEKVTPLVSGMELKSDVVDSELRVLVYDIGEGRIPAGETALFSVEVDGDLTVVEANAADYYGNDMNVTTATRILPTDFALLQNYPNPFNPSTDIVIEIPGPSEWKLDIYNVTGQLVESFSGYTAGGAVKVTWDAGDAASGVYFYKATAGQFTDVKKMVLMK